MFFGGVHPTSGVSVIPKHQNHGQGRDQPHYFCLTSDSGRKKNYMFRYRVFIFSRDLHKLLEAHRRSRISKLSNMVFNNRKVTNKMYVFGCADHESGVRLTPTLHRIRGQRDCISRNNYMSLTFNFS